MLGIIVQLAISWLLLWLFEKKNLGLLGFFPSKKRWTDFTLFFIITAACCASGFLLRFIFGNERWIVNPKLSGSLIADGIWWNIKSVLFEELIFRGALFYILIKKLGAAKAIIISAVAFGIYHWFSFGILGNVKQMVIVFFMTGLMGLLLAYGYAKTFSLYIPCAIHLGWNFTQGFIFSSGSTGNGILIQIKNQADVNAGYVIFFCILFLPVISMLLINYFLLKRRKQAVLVK